MKLVGLALLFVGLVAATSSSMVMVEERTESLPRAWTMGPRAEGSSKMTLYAMMRHNKEDVNKLEQVLMEVSDPRSDSYGMHLNLEETEKLTPISEEKLNTVKEFFGSALSLQLTPNRDIITIEITVSEVERLMSTEVHQFTNANGATLLRANRYSLPVDVLKCVYVIGDLVALPHIPSRPKVDPSNGPGKWPNACKTLSGCDGLVTPAVLKKRYTVDTSGMDASNNSFAVAEFQGQYFKQTDLDKFSEGCDVKVTVAKVIGGDVQRAGVESELDIEFIKGVSDGIDLTVIYSSQYSLLNWMTKVNGMDGAPWVHSVSYGNDEAQQTSVAYMESCNVQFMKAGVRGVSVLFASGDQGVCGREGCGGLKKKFHPDFPGASPYITAVGGTDFVTYDIGDEKAWSGSGGGFSDTFPIPSWQADAVASFKKDSTNLPPQSMWNNTGRGYPDVAALGGQKTPYCVVANGIPEGVAGTSASSPVVSSIFARLNGIRLAANKPTLGFLNPFIYQNPDAFFDVTQGCNGGSPLQTDCFEAIKGWDAATGMGTPNFEVLKTKI